MNRLKYFFNCQIFYYQLVLIVCFALLINALKAKEVEAITRSVNMQTTIMTYLAMTITSGGTVSFGNLTPGTPIAAPSGGTEVSVTTNADNGYTIGLRDGVTSTGSALLHTDTTTRITDYAGTIGTPTTWTGTGLGVTLFAADAHKNSKWGTGTTYNHSGNKYAGIPQSSTVAHTVTGYRTEANRSWWAWKVDVPNTQKTGIYSGTVTFTATAVLGGPVQPD